MIHDFIYHLMINEIMNQVKSHETRADQDKCLFLISGEKHTTQRRQKLARREPTIRNLNMLLSWESYSGNNGGKQVYNTAPTRRFCGVTQKTASKEIVFLGKPACLNISQQCTQHVFFFFFKLNLLEPIRMSFSCWLFLLYDNLASGALRLFTTCKHAQNNNMITQSINNEVFIIYFHLNVYV